MGHLICPAYATFSTFFCKLTGSIFRDKQFTLRFLLCAPGEVTIDLAQSPLDEEAEWHYLTTYKGRSLPDHLKRTFYADSGDLALPPTNYPPSRYSDSPVSDFEDGYSLYRDRLAEDYMLDRPTRPRGWRSNSPPSHRLGPDSSPPSHPRHIRCVHYPSISVSMCSVCSGSRHLPQPIRGHPPVHYQDSRVPPPPPALWVNRPEGYSPSQWQPSDDSSPTSPQTVIWNGSPPSRRGARSRSCHTSSGQRSRGREAAGWSAAQLRARSCSPTSRYLSPRIHLGRAPR